MLRHVRHTALLILGLLLLALVACGGTQPLPDIDATVEAKVEEALAAIPPPEVVVKEVPVEVVREVIKEVPVEKIVEVVKEVIVEKLIEVVVTATPKLQPWPMVI